jgi:MFS family permease
MNFTPEAANRHQTTSPAILLAMCCGIGFAAYVGAYMRIPVVPLFAESLGAGTAEVGVINATFLLTAGLLSFPFGLISDHWGRRTVVLGGLLASAISALLLALSRTTGQLVGIYLLFGTSVAAIGPTLMTYVAEIAPASHLGRAYGWYTLAIYSAMSLGPALGGALAQLLDYRPLFLISMGFIALVACFTYVYLPEPPARVNPAPGSAGLRHHLQELLRNRPLLGCWLATLAGCFGMGMFVTFFPLHAHNDGLSLARIGLIFMVQAAANALSRLPFGHLCDRPGTRVKLATLGLVSLGLTLAALALAHHLLHFLVLAVLLGLTMGMTFTPLGALIAEVAGPELRGLAMGGYNTFIYLGMMLSSAVMGYVIEIAGFPLSYLAAGLLLVVMAPGFVHLMKGFSTPTP